MTDIKSREANEVKGEGKEMEEKARTEADKATAREHVKGRVEEEVSQVRSAFGMSEWKG